MALFAKGKTMIRKLALAVGVAALGLTATACNTVKGLGQDVESVGQAGEEAID
jgi:predicted small secreted protein|tara:strand:+ start:801 stop:959 length:159 start_codon:yes stop_codon:yes gene_type:complete